MKRLDRLRPFGEVCPPTVIERCDRPAHYEQDGMIFDAHDREIVPGKPLSAKEAVDPPKFFKEPVGKAPVPVAEESDGTDDEPDVMDPGHLAENADTMNVALFRKEAQRILGKKCPKAKAEIVEALKKAAAKARKSGETVQNGMTWGDPTGKQRAAAKAEAEAASSPAPPPPPANVRIDLAAWGRGQKEYIWGEILKELRNKYKVQFSKKRDAVLFLVDSGVITAAQARKDVG
jgi:hypothetical protein